MGVYTSNNAMCEKVIWKANGRKLSTKNFDGENVDEFIKIHQICQCLSPVKILCHTVYIVYDIIYPRNLSYVEINL